MKTNIKTLICTFVAIAMAILSGVFIFVPVGVAEANSAWYKYDGVDAVGAIVRGENCPIVVDREDLTFDIYKEDLGTFYDEYEVPTGKVSAKYTFRNPTDITARVELLFPFGYAPECEADDTRDNKKYYSVTQDGSDIPKRIRNTYRDRRNDNYDIAQFDFAKDTEYLSEDYIEKYGFTKDTKVYEYVCGTNVFGRTQKTISIINNTDSQILCKLEHYPGLTNRYEKAYCDENEKATFFCFEKPNEGDISCRTSDDNSMKLNYEFVKETTLSEALASVRREDDNIEDVDLFNAFIARYDEEYAFINIDFEKEYRFRWYDYTLEFAPNQTIVNEVVAPLYPNVTRVYTPKVHKYTYLLSPAKTWVSFGEFHLRINTDMYVRNVSVGKMKKQKGYYEYTCQGLPDGELTFEICKSAAPITNNAWWGLVITGIALAVTSVIWIPILVFIIIKAHNKRKEKKFLQSYTGQKPFYKAVPKNEFDDDDSLFDDKMSLFDEKISKNIAETAKNTPSEDSQYFATESESQNDASDTVKTDAEGAETDTLAGNSQ